MKADHPVVFLSYSHDSEQHRETVLALSQRLRSDGFETRLDQYLNGSPEEGWPRWMLNQLDEATYVLVVCTPTYYMRFRGKGPGGAGKGVNWEGGLITQELYAAYSRNTKFVPVLFDAQLTDIPEPLRVHTCYHLTSESSYQLLCNFLRGLAGAQPDPVRAAEKPVRRQAKALRFDSAERTHLHGSRDLELDGLPAKASGLAAESSRIEDRESSLNESAAAQEGLVIVKGPIRFARLAKLQLLYVWFACLLTTCIVVYASGYPALPRKALLGAGVFYALLVGAGTILWTTYQKRRANGNHRSNPLGPLAPDGKSIPDGERGAPHA